MTTTGERGAANAIDVRSAAQQSDAPRRRKRFGTSRWAVLAGQLVVLFVGLAAWQFLPDVAALRSASHLFDPYFVSSPRLVAQRVVDLATGATGTNVWEHLWPTVYSALLGTTIGMAAGGLCGLVLSNFRYLSAVFRPFIVAANATPRIALIPIVVIIVGISLQTSVIISVMVVFFVAFFNAYEGGTTIEAHIIDNARLLGASSAKVLWHVRLWYVGAWTLTGLPLGVTFAVISVVTGEILTGYAGMGSLVVTAQTTGDATLTFAVVFYLAVVGLLIVAAAEFVRHRVVHWWGK